MTYLVIKFKGVSVPETVSVDSTFNADKLLGYNTEVEWWQSLDNGGYAVSRYASVPTVKVPPVPSFVLPRAENFPGVMEHVRNARKIQAIKVYREIMVCGLKEAKDQIDAAYDRYNRGF